MGALKFQPRVNLLWNFVLSMYCLSVQPSNGC